MILVLVFAARLVVLAAWAESALFFGFIGDELDFHQIVLVLIGQAPSV